jgi:hypothetical protein
MFFPLHFVERAELCLPFPSTAAKSILTCLLAIVTLHELRIALREG